MNQKAPLTQQAINKKIKITIRCTDEEYKYIRKAAYASEQSLNTFALESCLNEARNYLDEPVNEPGSGGY